MSRIGRKPIPVPDGVDVKIDGKQITVKGPKGTLTRSFHPEMDVKVVDKELRVERPSDAKRHRALHGTTRSIIANMIEGVANGFSKELELVGVGYRAQKKGKNLSLNVGYSHPVDIEPEEGIEFEVPSQTSVIVKGIDKERVGAVASRIRSVRKPEPYKGKGIKYKGERIVRKEGKAGK
ncbi:MAG: 50S ribosomal protein L6 [Novibacillus thermophilus]|jgi:large subunit ribosomal protein L6|uniref:Large ribosomal subunit protein uL6 n=1 Tax=Novibacillus thermophilus TaxID=1471761 RepID=A0A1U9K3C6_9BACL|nr:50S ribosomal protein L6 [Novibacillus thermophilus]AQS54543.1 50S ribosomal protein L6 [Novibacillus thermophilus]